jgi:hypothetical protein
MTLAATQYDTSSRSYLTIGDKVLIPAAYCTVGGAATTIDQWAQCTAREANQSPIEDTEYTLKFSGATVALAVAIPASTSLMVSGGNYAPGSQGAKPKASGWYSRTFKTAIKRAALAVEGSQQSDERYYEYLKGGGVGVMNKATMEADFRLNAAINDELLTGQLIDNITMTNRDGDSNAARGTLGIWPTLAARGMKLYYNGTMTITDFDLIKPLFISMGVSDKQASFFMGATLQRYLENSGLDFVKEYSGGTDFMKGFEQLSVGVKSVKKNDILVSFHELVNSTNPVKYGLSSYGYDKWGFIIPDTQVTVRKGDMEGANVKMKNLVFGEKVYNGEDRRRIVKFLPGVHGHSGYGDVAVDTYDDFRGEMLSEFALIFNKCEQSILVQNA